MSILISILAASFGENYYVIIVYTMDVFLFNCFVIINAVCVPINLCPHKCSLEFVISLHVLSTALF